jgi:hypothetical protein
MFSSQYIGSDQQQQIGKQVQRSTGSEIPEKMHGPLLDACKLSE